MDLLLDTHTFLWLVWNDPQLSVAALVAQANVENIPLVSADVIFDGYAGVRRLW